MAIFIKQEFLDLAMARKEDTFLLVSLKEAESKKLARVISNESSRQILAYLVNRNATETELSSKLGLPISTVHYNLQQLLKTGLIEAKEFHYSEKGKEVNHYSLAKKYIIIAPAGERIKTKLRNILPVAVIAAGAAGLIHLFSKGLFIGKAASFKAAEMAAETGDEILAGAPAMLAEGAPKSAAGLPIALWFLFGAVFAIVLYLIILLIRKR